MRAFESSAEDGSPLHVDTKTFTVVPAPHLSAAPERSSPDASGGVAREQDASAAVPAVEVRSTVGRGGTPRRRRPRRPRSSSGLRPPSGPTTTHTSPLGRRHERRRAARSPPRAAARRPRPGQPPGHRQRSWPGRRRRGTGPAATASRPPQPSPATGPAPWRRDPRASGSRTGTRPTARPRRRPTSVIVSTASLAAVALRQRLHDDEPGFRRRLVATLDDVDLDDVLAGRPRRRVPVPTPPVAVHQRPRPRRRPSRAPSRRAGPRARRGRPGRPQPLGAGDDEDRARSALVASLKASRSRPKKPVR